VGDGGGVTVRYTKWGGGRHWTLRGHRLGEDHHGVWVGVPIGTVASRPGAALAAERHHVILFPPALPCTAAFYQPLPGDGGDQIATYVDISTVPEWRDGEVTMVDLDLDVIRFADGSVVVDDEDEFAEHRVALGYPPEIVALAERSCAERLAEVRAGVAPYGDVGAAWLRRVSSLSPCGGSGSRSGARRSP
jgi:hypothetical protein